jgi:2,3-bisphosphoglycerate-dependent phosphoglycerate mutase
MKTRLLIARHGNTFAKGDVVRRVGITDLPLVDSGLQQGDALGRYLYTHDLIPDVIFASQLKRTIQTATAVLQAMRTELPIESLDIFNEIDYGIDENQPEEVVAQRVGIKAMQAWEQHAVVPEGWRVNPDNIIQNWQTFASHLLAHHTGKTCLVVTSNGIARFAPYLTGDFAAFSIERGIKIATGALCLFENEAPNQAWDCVIWNEKP